MDDDALLSELTGMSSSSRPSSGTNTPNSVLQLKSQASEDSRADDVRPSSTGAQDALMTTADVTLPSSFVSSSSDGGSGGTVSVEQGAPLSGGAPRVGNGPAVVSSPTEGRGADVDLSAEAAMASLQQLLYSVSAVADSVALERQKLARNMEECYQWVGWHDTTAVSPSASRAASESPDTSNKPVFIPTTRLRFLDERVVDPDSLSQYTAAVAQKEFLMAQVCATFRLLCCVVRAPSAVG